MFINKIKARESGILLYGITPPKAHTTADRLPEIAEKSIKTLCAQDIDALVVYDVQDEAERTTQERPFPFTGSIDPFLYASQYLEPLTVQKIIYRAAGMFTKDELTDWLDGLKKYKFHPVFVGLPAPDSIPKTSLPEAYAIWRERHGDASVIGAVTIPERHDLLKDEDARILGKVGLGVSYFISQCIFNVEFARKMLEDLRATCDKQQQPPPTIIFTLTICGSLRTIDFMEWLGIHIPDDIKSDLRACESPARRSVEIALATARELTDYCKDLSIPFGFNIESVATRREEVEASMELLSSVRNLLVEKGIRREAVMVERRNI